MLAGPGGLEAGWETVHLYPEIFIPYFVFHENVTFGLIRLSDTYLIIFKKYIIFLLKKGKYNNLK